MLHKIVSILIIIGLNSCFTEEFKKEQKEKREIPQLIIKTTNCEIYKIRDDNFNEIYFSHNCQISVK